MLKVAHLQKHRALTCHDMPHFDLFPVPDLPCVTNAHAAERRFHAEKGQVIRNPVKVAQIVHVPEAIHVTCADSTNICEAIIRRYLQ